MSDQPQDTAIDCAEPMQPVEPKAPAGIVHATFPSREARKDIMSEKIPELQLTWADLEMMELENEEHEFHFVEAARQAKRQYRGAHFIYLAGRPFIHRTINRRELAAENPDVAREHAIRKPPHTT